MERSVRKMWFAPKTFGYGAGLPVSWEGWTLLRAFLAAVILLGVVSRLYFSGNERALVHVGGIVLLLVPFILVVRARTEGGWRDGSG